MQDKSMSRYFIAYTVKNMRSYTPKLAIWLNLATLYQLFILVDNKWSLWSSWTSCTKSCAIGERIRSRICNNPSPQDGGKYCIGQRSEKEYCNAQKCHDLGMQPLSKHYCSEKLKKCISTLIV